MLIGNHVCLRAVERSDLPQLLEWRNQAEYRRFFREHRELNSDQQNQWFERTVLGDPNTRMFSIVDKDSLELLGAAGLCYINWIDRMADFSLYIGANSIYIDEILAPDAAQILLKFAFEELNLHRVWSEIYEFDRDKQHLFSKLGFSLDGRHRQTHWSNGCWHDSLFYGLLCQEFKK